MLQQMPLIAFIGTTDLSLARRFYTDLLGLRIVAESPFALEIDASGTMLRVTKVAEVKPAPYTALGWRVPDIVKTMKGLMTNGIIFQRYSAVEQDDLGIWTSPVGARVAWFKDPEGNVLSVAEFPTET